MIRSSVVLPEPDGPSRATNSPVATLRLTSRRAVKRAERLGDVADFDAHDLSPPYTPILPARPAADVFHCNSDFSTSVTSASIAKQRSHGEGGRQY